MSVPLRQIALAAPLLNVIVSPAEVKRMWVRPAARGASIGTAVLAELERRAIALGATRLALETADHLEAAVAIYERAGFTRCPCWGEYACSDSSICFEKLIA